LLGRATATAVCVLVCVWAYGRGTAQNVNNFIYVGFELDVHYFEARKVRDTKAIKA